MKMLTPQSQAFYQWANYKRFSAKITTKPEWHISKLEIEAMLKTKYKYKY